MQPISAIIVIKDNPPYALRAIDSIHDFVSEIIVGDIGIAPELKEKLALYQKTQIVPLQKPVPYVELVREKLKAYANQPYILFLDPDEILIPTLKEKIAATLPAYDFFSIPRKNLIFGKWIQHSRWWPDYQIRLFKKTAVTWPTRIHKQPTAIGKEKKFEAVEEAAIEHHNYESIDEYMIKAVRYAKAEAKEAYAHKSSAHLPQVIRSSISEFISRFFADQGYKDGMHGFVLAFLQMFYSFLVFFYLWELKKYPEMLSSELGNGAYDYFKQGLFETSFWLDKTGIKKRNVKDKIASKLL